MARKAPDQTGGATDGIRRRRTKKLCCAGIAGRQVVDAGMDTVEEIKPKHWRGLQAESA